MPSARGVRCSISTWGPVFYQHVGSGVLLSSSYVTSYVCALVLGSNREWPLLLKGATGLIYFASERLLADFRPEQLVSCSIPGKNNYMFYEFCNYKFC